MTVESRRRKDVERRGGELTNRAEDLVWLITGCSTGIGREIAKCALESGARVAVTARKAEAVADIVEGFPARAIAVALDVTRPEQIAEAVTATERAFGRIDVLVNNAGYGYVAAVEEGEEEDVRALFDTNFFGAIALIKAVLPGMRSRRTGFICSTWMKLKTTPTSRGVNLASQRSHLLPRVWPSTTCCSQCWSVK
jgi:NAD(P)-dependent dehydrogenase (short-subunit alcohol dehydrogenase family)